jgi:hypothetical protein
MTEPRCDWSDLPVSMCAHCRPAEDDTPSEEVHWLTARYAGCCADCGGAIEPGDRIAFTDDDYLCGECGE